ncbi:hypothetical protein I316_07613 [Kwoniella heveanensis BCC8398]|uniref:Uncharacterized protein n=1 Tax=Kwoniella heveanensis BCC8398 TaxID=1296120 RepID=A0A1B9GIC6_9TREE|nr:hypothetical protein I316_07613 [Kwoniella heveanensis BCC8398]
MPADHLEAGAPLLILAPGQMAFTQPRMSLTTDALHMRQYGTYDGMVPRRISGYAVPTDSRAVFSDDPYDDHRSHQPVPTEEDIRAVQIQRTQIVPSAGFASSTPQLQHKVISGQPDQRLIIQDPNGSRYAPAVTGIVHPDGGITRFAEPRWADSELRLQSEQQFAEDDPEMTLREADGIIEDQSQLITEQQTKIEDLERRNRELKSQVETLTAALQQWREFTQSYTGTALSSELPLHTADSTVLDQTQLEAYSANHTTTIPPHVITDAMGDGQTRYVQQYQNVTEAEDHSDTTHSSATMTRGLSSNGEPKGKGRAQ